MFNPRHQTTQGQSVGKHGTPLQNLRRESKYDIKTSEGNKVSLIFKGGII